MGDLRLLVGCYRKAGGAGLYPLDRRTGEDRWVLGEADPRIENASFGVASTRGIHYLVDEQAATVGAYAATLEGLHYLGSLASGGAQPCYLSLDATETWRACANYGGGSVTLFRLGESGSLAERSFLYASQGRSLDPDRQEGPHVHCAVFSPDQGWLHTVDLGTDQILSFPFDAERGVTGDPVIGWAALPGCGPRHLVFHPRLLTAYLVSELSSTLTVLDRGGNGIFVSRDVHSTLPKAFRGHSLGGHLTLNAAGDRLYVSNRGHDSIATFAIDEQGDLHCLGHVESGGGSPRFVLLIEDEDLAWVANEDGGNVVLFHIRPHGLVRAHVPELSIPGAAFVCCAAAGR